METEPRRSDSGPPVFNVRVVVMRSLGIALILAVVAALVAGVLVAVAYGLGWGLGLVLDLSQGDATLAVLLAALGLLVAFAWSSIAGKLARIEDELEEEEADAKLDDDEREEMMEELVEQLRRAVLADGLPRVNDPCPCGSRKKYKNCCGK